MSGTALTHTVVLTSRQNFVWQSMQVIIPSIEGLWRDSQLPGRHEVHVVDVDENKLDTYLPLLMKAQNVVMTCFTPKLARVLEVLRRDFGLDARYLITLHNQATIACWPFRKWGLGNVLRSSDIFISSCRLDAGTLSQTFENARVEVIPFTFQKDCEQSCEKHPELDYSDPAPSFVYVGRLSPQKNLHLLLYAFSLFSRWNPRLDFKLELFGGSDDLGSPNMGLEVPGYENYLRTLAGHLDLGDRVVFHGFLPREELNRRLSGKRHVFVSASLHSDENFGMAAFQSLCHGHSAVLSRWGGHVDFGDSFPGQVRFSSVYASPGGPFIDPKEFAAELNQAAKHGSREPKFRLPAYYNRRRLAERLRELALREAGLSAPLVFTALANRILENQELYLRESPRQSKIFSSYADPLAEPFFRGYGMVDRTSDGHAPKGKPVVCPWVSLGGSRDNGENRNMGRATVNDPHRGHFEIPVSQVVEYGFGFLESDPENVPRS